MWKNYLQPDLGLKNFLEKCVRRVSPEEVLCNSADTTTILQNYQLGSGKNINGLKKKKSQINENYLFTDNNALKKHTSTPQTVSSNISK